MQTPFVKTDRQQVKKPNLGKGSKQKKASEPHPVVGLPIPNTSSRSTQQPPRREGLRQRPPQELELPIPRKAPKATSKSGNDPNGYLRVPSSRQQYQAGVGNKISTTPHLGPAPDRATLQRIPPRPQNRQSGPNEAHPKSHPLPRLKPIPGGRTGLEGTSFEAPEGKTESHLATDIFDREKDSSSKGKGKGKANEPTETSNAGLGPQTLPLRPNTQKNTDSIPKDRVSRNLSRPRKGKENQKLPEVSSPVAERVRPKQNPAVKAAQKAMAEASKKKGLNSKQDS